MGLALSHCSESFKFEQQNLYDCYVPDFMYVFMPVCLYVCLSGCLSQTMVAVWVKTMEWNSMYV